MTIAARFILTGAILLVGCKTKFVPCMSMSPPGEVLQHAALLRLDVYGSDVHCVGSTISAGAPVPQMTKVVSVGQPIQLDVPAGPHVLLLSAYSDAAGTVLIGSACTAANLSADVGACFNLTLIETPGGVGMPDLANPNSSNDASADLAIPPMDMLTAPQPDLIGAAPPDLLMGSPPDLMSTPCNGGCGSLQCCSTQCIDISMSISHCGDCNRPCVGTNVATPVCSGGLCKPMCNPGWGDCNHPIAPAADDGCETNLYDVNHCGACVGAACNLPNAIPDCPAGSCIIKSCADANHFDCNAKASDGCECAGVNLGDGANGCCGTGCQTQHQNGLGQQFYDCLALAAYSLQLAEDAASVFTPAGAQQTHFANPATCPGGSSHCVFCKRGANAAGNPVECACWEYSGPNVGHVSHVMSECQYPAPADPTFK